jgi:hypothetical protein
VCCAGLKLGGVGFQGEDSLDREFLIYLPVFSVLSSFLLLRRAGARRETPDLLDELALLDDR